GPHPQPARRGHDDPAHDPLPRRGPAAGRPRRHHRRRRARGHRRHRRARRRGCPRADRALDRERRAAAGAHDRTRRTRGPSRGRGRARTARGDPAEPGRHLPGARGRDRHDPHSRREPRMSAVTASASPTTTGFGPARTVRLGLARVGYEVRSYFRQGDTVFFTFLFPLVMLTIFSIAFSDAEFGRTPEGDPVTAAQYYLPAMLAAGVLLSGLQNMATDIAMEK